MSKKDPYSLDEFDELNEDINAYGEQETVQEGNAHIENDIGIDDPNHFDPSIAPEDNFPDSSLEKTLMHEMPSQRLDEATEVSETFYEATPPLENAGQPLGDSVLQLAPDVAVQVTAMIGRKSATVKDLLDLKMGDVVEFDRKPMDPLDIVVAGQVIAKAELVVVDGRLGVRVLKLFK